MNGMSTSKYIPTSPICTEPFSSKYSIQEDIGRDEWPYESPNILGGVGGTVDSESTLRSAGTLLLGARTQPLVSWPDERPESLRSPCCGQTMYIQPTQYPQVASIVQNQDAS
ncbi:hypothetical protein PoB_005807100 [Plakobranchus ocellatus]|uniref:Uncharacterized protein n=1 Tax=Plakobranchus ocellatus TaxID=259542 RepID=A0AAV4CFK7_9GAST|nr:hypothetical protein PoB_005807100 [Plakobranchus ocellatus]